MKLLFLLQVLVFVQGHNWMVSPSRVPFAATVFPCMGPRTLYPHVQVAVDQEFQLEWATGHDRMVYFVLLKKNDSDKLSQHSIRTTGNLEKYISDAATLYGQSATGLLNYQASPMLCANCKYHRTSKSPTSTHALGGMVKDHYAPPGPLTNATGANPSPFYRPRPTEFGSQRSQYAYVSSVNDRYYSYKHPSYPWIISLWRYEIQEADPGEWDMNMVKIPTSYGPGDYIIHYLWSGYYDCIDINVLPRSQVPGDVPYPYGKAVAGAGALKSNRVDHCIFDDPQLYVAVPRPLFGTNSGAEPVLGAVENCIKSCRDGYEQGACGGVSAFPLSLISKNWGPHWVPTNNLIKRFYDLAWDVNGRWSNPLHNHDEAFPYDSIGSDNITRDLFSGLWRNYTYSATSASYRGINQTTLDTLRVHTETSQGSDPWVCVLVSPRAPSTTVDKYTISDDPMDPIFYMTCYEILEQKEFIGYNTTLQQFNPTIPQKFSPGDTSGCISCDDKAAWAIEAYTPRWATASKCTLCERLTTPPVFRSWLYPQYLQMWSSASISTPPVNTTCSGQIVNDNPAVNFTSWSEYCLIPHAWSHPLLGDSTANANTYKWWVGGPNNNPLRGSLPYMDKCNISCASFSLATRTGWQNNILRENIHKSMELCAQMVLRDSRCSEIFEYDENSQGSGCRCVRKDPLGCCKRYLLVGSSSTTATTTRALAQAKAPVPGTDPELDELCSRNVTGLRSTADPTLCCKVPSGSRNACGTTGCAALTGGNSVPGAFCRGWQIPKNRCCKLYAPPCRVCPP